MHCEVAGRMLYAGASNPELEVHLSACDECRLLAVDLAGLGRAFDRARAEWAPSPAFRVRLPAAPWRRLAIAASLLFLPLAGLAATSLPSPRPEADLAVFLEHRQAPALPSDREILATLFLEEARR